jgi:hypothetical protein
MLRRDRRACERSGPPTRCARRIARRPCPPPSARRTAHLCLQFALEQPQARHCGDRRGDQAGRARHGRPARSSDQEGSAGRQRRAPGPRAPERAAEPCRAACCCPPPVHGALPQGLHVSVLLLLACAPVRGAEGRLCLLLARQDARQGSWMWKDGAATNERAVGKWAEPARWRETFWRARALAGRPHEREARARAARPPRARRALRTTRAAHPKRALPWGNASRPGQPCRPG